MLLKPYFHLLHAPSPYVLSLYFKAPQTVPPTPGTALQNKIESKLEKSLGNQFNIQLQQQIGVFQASMLEAMKSLREEMQSMKKASEAEVDETFASPSKAGPSKQSVELSGPNIHPNPPTSDYLDAQPMETDFCGPSLPPRFGQSVQSNHGSKHSDLHSEHLDPQSKHSEQPQRVCSSRAKKHSDKKKHKDRGKYYSQSSSSEEDQSLLKSLLSPKRLLMSKTNKKITQTQSFTGR